MSVTLPGTNIVVDHFRDRTWQEEMFCLFGTDYRVRLWRERLAFADPEETEVVYRERGVIDASENPAVPGEWLPGKPRWIEVLFSEIIAKGGSTPLDAVPGAPMLSDIGTLIVQSNEIVCAVHAQRRILDYRFRIGNIDEAQYAASIAALLLVTSEG